MRYRRIVVQRAGEPEVMEIVEEELPTPGAGQALVKVLAADISFSDVNIRRGRYPGAPRPPFTPGYAVAGVVDRLGPGASQPEVGQIVAALTFYGGYSQYICIAVDDLVVVGTDVDPVDAVALVLSHVSAYQMLHRVARVAAGQRVLVHGGAGGVGTAFLELGRLAGLETYATASKPKHGLVERLGATPIDYRNEDFVARIAMFTNGQGVDCAFDPIGSAHLKRSLQAVRRNGTVVAYGFYESANRGSNVLVDVLRQYMTMAVSSLPPRRKPVAFYDIRRLKKTHRDWFSSDLGALLDLLAAGRVKPVIAGRVPLDGVVEAHHQIERAEVQGKLILVPNG